MPRFLSWKTLSIDGLRQPMIRARQLTKVFHDKKRGEIAAVDRVDFTCEPGKIFGLLGCNGAGKTTCLRMLAALIRPSAGSATVNGFDVVRAILKKHWFLRQPQRSTAASRLTKSSSILDGCTGWTTACCGHELTSSFGPWRWMSFATGAAINFPPE